MRILMCMLSLCTIPNSAHYYTDRTAISSQEPVTEERSTTLEDILATTDATEFSSSWLSTSAQFALTQEALLRLFYRLITDLEFNLNGLKEAFTDCCLTCPESYSLLGPGPTCYKVSDRELPWQQAQKHCQDEGGNLVGFETQFEEFLVLDYVAKNQNPPLLRFYTSGNELNKSQIWKWGNNKVSEPFSFTHWAPGEPNDDLTEEEDCMEVIVGRGWNDVPCYLPFRFICEHKPILKITQ